VISTNYLINPNNMPIQTLVPPTGQNQATAQSLPSVGSSDVNKLLNDTNYLTAGMQATALQNERIEQVKKDQEVQNLALKKYQESLVSALPANQPNASQPSGTSPTNSPTVMPRSASVPASDPSNPVDQIKGFG